MASNIDITKPVEGTPTTQSVRDNFSAAKTEINNLGTSIGVDASAGGAVVLSAGTIDGIVIGGSTPAAATFTTVTFSTLTTDSVVGDTLDADLTITPNGTGNVLISGLSYPSSDGSSGEVLTTDGAGTVSFQPVSGLISVNADDVSFTPYGDLAAVDVQAALEELDDEKLPIASPTYTGTMTTPLTASRVPIINSSSELAVSSVTPTELGYVSGVTSALQTQISAKAPSASPTFSGTITTPLTASRALITNGSSELAASSVTSTQLGYVSGVTSSIQTQLDGKVPLVLSGDTTITAAGSYFNLDAATFYVSAVGGTFRVYSSSGTSYLASRNDPDTDTTCQPMEIDASDILLRLIDTTGDIELDPDTGTIILDGLVWPTADGSSDQVLKTDGAGNLSFDSLAGLGGISAVVDDTTPQLGGDLDVNSNSIVSVSGGDIAISPDTTGDIVLDGLKWPQADGSAGYFLTTDGLGQLSWAASSSTFIGDTDTPASFVGAANYKLVVNATPDAVVFEDDTIGNINDVTLTGLGDGELLVSSSGTWINQTLAEAGIQPAGSYLTDITGESLGDLSDVTETAVTNDEILQYTGAGWENQTLAEAGIQPAGSYLTDISAEDIGDLNNVTEDTPSDNDVLQYVTDHWENQTLAEAGIQPAGSYLTDITGESLGDLSDVTETAVTNDEVLQYTGSGWENQTLAEAGIQPAGSYLTDITGESLGDLSDVTETAVTNDEILQYTGAGWENQTLAEAGIQPAGSYLTTVQASDVDAEASTDGYVLTSDGAGNAAWEAIPSGVSQLSDLSDVGVTTPTDKNALMADGDSWESRALVKADISDSDWISGISGESLGDLSDVTETAVTNDEVLQYTGSGWENQTLAEAGIQPAGSYLTDITGESLGDLSDVTETAVTNDEVLQYTGSGWENQTLAEAGIQPAGSYLTTVQASDVDAEASTDGYVLTSDGAGNAAWEAVPAIADVVSDTTPQLGGDLDVNGNSIISASAGDIAITPDTTGDLILDGLKWPQSDGSADQVLKTDGAGQLSWDSLSFGALGDLSDVTETVVTNDEVLQYTGSGWENQTLAEAGIQPAGSYLTTVQAGDVDAEASTDGYVLTSDGAGNAAWEAVPGITDIVSDTTPQLGGDLDVNGNSIISASAGDIAITPDTTGDIVLDGLKWPQADGSADQVLKTDGAGQLSWVDNGAGAGTPAGSDTEIQYNDSGSFGASANFYLSSNRVYIGADSDGFTGLRLVDESDATKVDLYYNDSNGETVLSMNGGGNAAISGPTGATMSLSSASGQPLYLTPGTTGDLILDGQKWPQSDGSANQILTTDGAGQISWVTSGYPYVSINSTGTAASATGTDAIAVGEGASASGAATVSIGSAAATTSTNAILISAVGGSIDDGVSNDGILLTTGSGVDDGSRIQVRNGGEYIIIGSRASATTTSAYGSIMIGQDAEVINGQINTSSIAIGSNAVIDGFDQATAIGPGARGLQHSAVSFGGIEGGVSSTTGADFGHGIGALHMVTTDATQTEMKTDLGANPQYWTIPSDSTWGFECMLVARRADADNESAFWKLTFCIDNNAGTTALVGSVKTETIADDSGGGWMVSVTADDTNDRPAIKVTGEVGKTIRWMCSARMVKVSG